jgi:Ca2+-binding EF-hand superfamily protein
MGIVFSSKSGLTPEELSQLKVDTDLSKSNLRKLYSRFQHLDRGNKGYLDKSDLMTIPEVTSSYLSSRRSRTNRV